MSDPKEGSILLPERMRDPEPRTPAIPGEVSPASMIAMVMQRGGTIEQLAQFVQFKREWEADEAHGGTLDKAEWKFQQPQRALVDDKRHNQSTGDST